VEYSYFYTRFEVVILKKIIFERPFFD